MGPPPQLSGFQTARKHRGDEYGSQQSVSFGLSGSGNGPETEHPCVCGICTCGKHFCPAHPTKNLGEKLETTAGGSYSGRQGARATSFKPQPSLSPEKVPFTARSSYQTDLDGTQGQRAKSFKPALKPLEVTPFDGRTTKSETDSAVIGKGERAKSFKPCNSLMEKHPFDGTTTNGAEFFEKPLDKNAKRKLKGSSQGRSSDSNVLGADSGIKAFETTKLAMDSSPRAPGSGRQPSYKPKDQTVKQLPFEGKTTNEVILFTSATAPHKDRASPIRPPRSNGVMGSPGISLPPVSPRR